MKNLKQTWSRGPLVLLFFLVALVFLYRDTALAMVGIWNRSETFAHAFVVPPIALWLIWRQRALLAQETPQAAPVFLLPMAAMALLWLLGELAAVNAATQLAFTGMLVLLVPTLLGWRVSRHILFPLGFLFFAVPIGEFMMPQLMVWTADFTVAALRLSGIPVYREGLQFNIPSGTWSVVEACSGIRYLMASLMVGTLFAYLNFRSYKRRWLFVAFSAVLPLAANWLRAYMIVMLGHISGNELATGADHLVYGWVLFGIIMLAMFMIGSRWAEPESKPVPGGASTKVMAVSAHALTLLMLTGVLVAPPLFMHISTDVEHPISGIGTPDLSAQGWQLDASYQQTFKPHFEDPRAELVSSYQQGADKPVVGLYIAYYHRQSSDSKLVSSSNVLVQPQDRVWAQVEAGKLEQGNHVWRTAELRGASLAANAFNQRRLHAWQIYWVNGRFLASDWQAKVWGALGRLSGQGDDGAVIVIHAPKTEAGQGEQALAAFASDNLSSIEGVLQELRRSQRQSANLK